MIFILTQFESPLKNLCDREKSAKTRCKQKANYFSNIFSDNNFQDKTHDDYVRESRDSLVVQSNVCTTYFSVSNLDLKRSSRQGLGKWSKGQKKTIDEKKYKWLLRRGEAGKGENPNFSVEKIRSVDSGLGICRWTHFARLSSSHNIV